MSHHPASKKKTILILGASLLQLPAIKAAKSMDWNVIVADVNPTAVGVALADVFEHVDLADPEAMLAMARSYHQKDRLDGVFTAGTDFSATVAYVCEHLSLPGIPYETALNASIKSRMRSIFKSAGIPSPRFVEIAQDAVQPEQQIAHLTFPLVIKPVDNMGGRGVQLVQNRGTFAQALAQARGFSRRSLVIVEEFIDGPEFSIDSLVYDGIVRPYGIADRHIYFSPRFVELGHTMPSNLPAEKLQQLVEVFSKAVQALGITWGVAKGDVFWSKDGPVIGEIAARLSGGYMSGWTFPLSSGINVTQAALMLAVGERPSAPERSLSRTCAERAVVSIPGLVQSIEGVRELKRQDGVHEVFMRCKAGDAVVFPLNNVQKAGNVIASHAEPKKAIAIAEQGVGTIIIQLVPNNFSTEQYLCSRFHADAGSAPDGFYPAAFPYFMQFLRQGQPTAMNREAFGHLPAAIRLSRNLWDYTSLEATVTKAALLFGSSLPACFWVVAAKAGYQGLVYCAKTLDELSLHARNRRIEQWSQLA